MQDFHNDKTLGLFFSYGVGIGTWEKQGYLNRELKYYVKLAEKLGLPTEQAGRVYFFTYDNALRQKMFKARHSEPEGEESLLERITNRNLSGLSIFPKRINFPNFSYSFLMPFLQGRAIKKCDILKTNQMSGALPAIIAKIIYRKKLVVRCGYEWLYSLIKAKKPLWKRAIVYCLSALAYKTADRIIFTSKPDKDFAQKKFKIQEGKIAIIPNYIDTDLFKPMPDTIKEANSVCYVGRLSQEKNLGVLIEAIGELPQVKLYLAGDGPARNASHSVAGGPEKQALQEQAKNNKNIVFLGKVPNEQLPALLNKCEIFALPSLYEGNPKALLEAMACGLPCIASDIDGIREIIIHNHNGLLVKPDKTNLKQAIALLFKDKSFSERFGHQARQTILDNFSLPNVLQKELDNL